jgi:hypothetical protein
MKVLLASLLALTPVSASAEYVDSRSGYAHTQKCYRSEYREEYIPGSEDNPGYVKSWKETIEYPCNTPDRGTRRQVIERQYEVDDNDCTDGKVAGAILGGGVGAALSRDEGRWWAIPLGVVTGSAIGCDIDGG